MGHSFLEFCGAPRREALRQALSAVAQGQQVDNFDLPLVRNDGASGQFTVNMSPISGEDGKVTNIVVVMTDVTDSAILRSKLVHAEKMAAVGQLVSGVAHEVNNPLTAILGFTDLLMESPDIPESARHDLRVILQEAQRTKQIVQNLLSFARQMPPLSTAELVVALAHDPGYLNEGCERVMRRFSNCQAKPSIEVMLGDTAAGRAVGRPLVKVVPSPRGGTLLPRRLSTVVHGDGDRAAATVARMALSGGE